MSSQKVSWIPEKLTTPMRISLAIGLIGSALLVGLVVTQTEKGRNAKLTGQIELGGAFSLLNQTGQRVTEADFAGRHMLVYFGFTNCPHICPAGLQIMAQALDNLAKDAPQKAAAIEPVLITIDPTRDTPEVLGDYVSAFHPRLTGLTGSEEEINAVVKAYKAYTARIADDNSVDGYTMDHSAFFYLMGPDGAFIKHFDSALAPEKMAAQLAHWVVHP